MNLKAQITHGICEAHYVGVEGRCAICDLQRAHRQVVNQLQHAIGQIELELHGTHRKQMAKVERIERQMRLRRRKSA